VPTDDAKVDEKEAVSDEEAAEPAEVDDAAEPTDQDDGDEPTAAEPEGDGADADADAMGAHVAEEVDEVAEEMEEILDGVTTAESERDEFRDHLLRLQADFDNYRKRVQKELGEAGDKALGRFVEELLPVLDAVDAARVHGANEVDQVANLLVDLLAKQGLERLGGEGDVFDPNLHDAVIHEAGDQDVQTVVQVLRAGWRWRGRVLRPAMVKVVG
jgi:molecular chaperone GrpE